MSKIIKKITVAIVILALAFTTILGDLDTTVNAVETEVSDDTVKGSGSFQSAKGSWCTDTSEPTLYRVYPIKLETPLNTVDKGSKVTLDYAKQYYYFRDLALYTTSDKKATEAYQFTSPTTRSKKSIADMTLSSDGSYDFTEICIGLNLPTHTFSINESKYVGFSDELNKKFITEGEDANIGDIFYFYITEIKARRSKLSDKGKKRLDELIELSGYGTDSFDDFCQNFGFVFELCSTATNMHDGKKYVLSYGDMTKGCKIGNDPYYIYKVFDEANKDNSLLTWEAEYHSRNIKIVPEDALGEATYFFCNANIKKSVAQSLNITLSVDRELSANISTSDVLKTFRVSTSELNPDVELGATEYTKVMKNAYENSLPFTKIKLSDNTVLKTSDKMTSLNTLSGKPDYAENSILLGYQTLSIPIKATKYNLDDLSKADITNALSQVTASTNTTVVSNGFGNRYSLNFKVNDTTVRSSVANAIKEVNGVSAVNAGTARARIGKIKNMADLQSSTLLSSKVVGKPSKNNLKNANGTIYASISYLAKDKKVTSKEAETYIDKDANVSTVSSSDAQSYSVTSTANWGIIGKNKSYTYAIAWRANDYDLTDEKSLTESILSSLGTTYVLRGEAGANTLAQGFQQATGVQPLGVKFMKKENTIEVGSTPNDDNSLSGIDTLVINVSYDLPVNIVSEDIIDSNQLNYVYPNLLGWKSSANTIIPIAAYTGNIMYPYTVSDNNAGDLIGFKGSNVHYYYDPTGLFGGFSQKTKSFYDTSYPSYAYNISRALWGDNFVASSYRGLTASDEAIKNDIKNNLGFTIGDIGGVPTVTCGENVDSTVDTKKEDRYNFTGTITRDYGEYTETVYEYNKYSIVHSLNKYTCLALDTALNKNSGKAGFNIQENAGIKNKVTMVTQSKDTLTVYPEIAYQYYLANTNSGVLNSVSPLTVYVMGERARIMKPSSIRGIDMDYKVGETKVATGDIKSDGTLVGSNADSMSEGKQVIAQGTDITMKADHNVDYRLISYSLDVIDSYSGVSVRNDFSSDNIKYKPKKEHEDYVQDFIDKVKVDTYMNIGNKEYEMVTNNVTPKVSKDTVDTFFSIEFRDGKIDEMSKNSVINDMSKEYGVSIEQAEQMFNSAGFEQQLQSMFESNTDADNGSKNKWYDEESVTLVIRKYVTVVDLDELLVQDKIDYNTVGVAGLDEKTGQSIHQTADAYFTMSVSLPKDFEGCDLVHANKLFVKQPIKDSEFKVMSSTTYDFEAGFGDD